MQHILTLQPDSPDARMDRVAGGHQLWKGGTHLGYDHVNESGKEALWRLQLVLTISACHSRHQHPPRQGPVGSMMLSMRIIVCVMTGSSAEWSKLMQRSAGGA